MGQLRVVVDGYNLIHKIPELARMVGTDLERARDALVSSLAVYRSRRNVRVTVVFDGRGMPAHNRRYPGGIEVVFSRAPQTADQKIKMLISLEKSPRSWTVVTSDNSIAIYARDYGAKTIRSEDFAVELGRPARPMSSRGGTDDKPEMTGAEVAEWEEFFRRKPGA
jgi:predicted RNA-binding protein with PIN domain